MKRIVIISAVFVVAFFLAATVSSQATDFEAFSKNLVKALKSDNQGLQVSAISSMQNEWAVGIVLKRLSL